MSTGNLISNLQTRLFNPKYSRKPNHRVNPDPVQMAARIGDTEAALDFHSPNKTYGYDLQALTDEQQQRLIKSAHFERHPILIALRHGHLETARGLYDQAKDSDKERILKYLIFNPQRNSKLDPKLIEKEQENTYQFLRPIYKEDPGSFNFLKKDDFNHALRESMFKDTYCYVSYFQNLIRYKEKDKFIPIFNFYMAMEDYKTLSKPMNSVDPLFDRGDEFKLSPFEQLLVYEEDVDVISLKRTLIKKLVESGNNKVLKQAQEKLKIMITV